MCYLPISTTAHYQCAQVIAAGCKAIKTAWFLPLPSRTSVAACVLSFSNEHHKSLQRDACTGNVAITVWKYCMYVWGNHPICCLQIERRSPMMCWVIVSLLLCMHIVCTCHTGSACLVNAGTTTCYCMQPCVNNIFYKSVRKWTVFSALISKSVFQSLTRQPGGKFCWCVHVSLGTCLCFWWWWWRWCVCVGDCVWCIFSYKLVRSWRGCFVGTLFFTPILSQVENNYRRYKRRKMDDTQSSFRERV